jgi:hypothetical protein
MRPNRETPQMAWGVLGLEIQGVGIQISQSLWKVRTLKPTLHQLTEAGVCVISSEGLLWRFVVHHPAKQEKRRENAERRGGSGDVGGGVMGCTGWGTPTPNPIPAPG